MQTILVVDDDPAIREALALLLEDEGHAVLTAPDGLAALEAAVARSARVLLRADDPEDPYVRSRDRRERAEHLGERLCPDPALGPWACRELADACAARMRRWLLVRCDAEDPDEHASFLAYGPEETTVAEWVRVCTTRWQIEEGFAQAKGEIGLDQYEVRTWEAWHRHATLCLLAHA